MMTVWLALFELPTATSSSMWIIDDVTSCHQSQCAGSCHHFSVVNCWLPSHWCHVLQIFQILGWTLNDGPHHVWYWWRWMRQEEREMMCGSGRWDARQKETNWDYYLAQLWDWYSIATLNTWNIKRPKENESSKRKPFPKTPLRKLKEKPQTNYQQIKVLLFS